MALDLEFTEIEEMLRDAALSFLKRDVSKELLQSLQDTDTGTNDEIWQTAVDMGWLGIIIPEKYGGTENSLTNAGVLFEALGTAPLPGPFFSSGILGSQIILETGSDEQKEATLPEVALGQRTLALALTEPAYSWEPGAVQTTATKDGGDYVINGLKLYVPDAAAATHLIVAAKTENGGSPALFLVDKNTPGLTITRIPGFLTGQNFEIKLDSVKVPASDMLGDGGAAWAGLQTAIQKSIPVLSAYKVGGCQSLFEITLDYSRVRVAFGQAIGRFQRVQDLIIEMLNHLESARWTTYEALWKLDENMPADESVHLSKMMASNGYWETVTLAHQVVSGLSYSREHNIAYHNRASRALFNFLGEPAYHKRKLGELLVNLQ